MKSIDQSSEVGVSSASSGPLIRGFEERGVATIARRLSASVVVTAIALLSACGGGGDDGTSNVGSDNGAGGGTSAPPVNDGSRPPIADAPPGATSPTPGPGSAPSPTPGSSGPTPPPPGSGPTSPGSGSAPPGAGTGESGRLQIAVTPNACLAISGSASGQVLELTSPVTGPTPVTTQVELASDNAAVVALANDGSANFQVRGVGAGTTSVRARVAGEQTSAVVSVRSADVTMPVILKSGCLLALHASVDACGTIKGMAGQSFVQRINVAGNTVAVQNCAITENPAGIRVIEF